MIHNIGRIVLWSLKCILIASIIFTAVFAFISLKIWVLGIAVVELLIGTLIFF